MSVHQLGAEVLVLAAGSAATNAGCELNLFRSASAKLLELSR
jgi:hypothetical protein